jgi:fatty-acyl-CoA synthase
MSSPTSEPRHAASGAAAAAATLTVGERFSAQARLRGAAVALEHGATRRSFAELDARSARLAGWLAAQGVRRGDRVAMLSENRAEYVELFLAAARLGAIVACQNWRQSDAELARCLALVEPVLVLVSERLAPTLERLAPTATPRTLGLGAPYEAALAAGAPLPARTDLDGEDGLLLLYTSGTTGAPKAALISHRAMIARSLVHALDRRTDPEAAFVAWTPFFHMGATDASFATLMGGGKLIVMDGFDAEALVDVVVREPVGHLTIVPGVVERFLEAWQRRGAAPCGVGVVGVMADLVPPRWIASSRARSARPTATPSARPRPARRRPAAASSASASCRSACPSCKARCARCACSTPRAPRCRTARPASSRCAARRCSPATGMRRRRTPRSSATAGTTWATCWCATPTARSTTSTARST